MWREAIHWRGREGVATCRGVRWIGVSAWIPHPRPKSSNWRRWQQAGRQAKTPGTFAYRNQSNGFVRKFVVFMYKALILSTLQRPMQSIPVVHLLRQVLGMYLNVPADQLSGRHGEERLDIHQLLHTTKCRMTKCRICNQSSKSSVKVKLPRCRYPTRWWPNVEWFFLRRGKERRPSAS